MFYPYRVVFVNRDETVEPYDFNTLGEALDYIGYFRESDGDVYKAIVLFYGDEMLWSHKFIGSDGDRRLLDVRPFTMTDYIKFAMNHTESGMWCWSWRDVLAAGFNPYDLEDELYRMKEVEFSEVIENREVFVNFYSEYCPKFEV